MIPAKDEAENLPELLEAIQKTFTCTIIVVDNNSKDQTATIAKRYTNHVVKESKSGYGNACLCGIRYANGLNPRPELICFFDGDGQSLVSDIEKVVRPLIQKESLHYCQGSRMKLNSAKSSLKGISFLKKIKRILNLLQSYLFPIIQLCILGNSYLLATITFNHSIRIKKSRSTYFR